MKRRPPTTLEFALLGLIHQEAQSGYDLCKSFETTPMAHYSSSPGAIYPALKRLEARSLIDGEVEGDATLRPRKVYRLTPDGLDTLRGWSLHRVTRDDVVWNVDELMLRFGFMGQLVGGEDVRRFLDRLATHIDDLVLELESYRDGMIDAEKKAPATALPTGRLALEQGISSYRSLADWARRARRELEADHPERTAS